MAESGLCPNGRSDNQRPGRLPLRSRPGWYIYDSYSDIYPVNHSDIYSSIYSLISSLIYFFISSFISTLTFYRVSFSIF